MKRSVIQLAKNTKVISLPAAWCIHHAIKKGDELSVQERRGKLVVSPDEDSQTHSHISKDISGMSTSAIWHILRSFTTRGYDQISLRFDRETAPDPHTKKEVEIHPLVERIMNESIGYEVLEQKGNEMICTKISEPRLEELPGIINRIFLTLLSNVSDLNRAIIANDLVALRFLSEQADVLVNRLSSYALRIVRNTTEPDTYETLTLILTLRDLGDIHKLMVRSLLTVHNKKMYAPITEGIEQTLRMAYSTLQGRNDQLYRSVSANQFRVIDLLKQLQQKKNDRASLVPLAELFLKKTMHVANSSLITSSMNKGM